MSGAVRAKISGKNCAPPSFESVMNENGYVRRVSRASKLPTEPALQTFIRLAVVSSG